MASTIVAAGAALVLLAFGATAYAQTQVTPLPDGQVLLEISARGSVRTPASSITLTLQVMSGASKAASAKAANQVKLAALIKALEPFGIQPKDMDVSTIATMGMDDEDLGPSQPPVQFSQATVQVTLAEPSKLAAVREVLNRQDVGLSNIISTTKEGAAAQRLAIADAVAKARNDASTYADALGLRIVKIVHVTNGARADDPTYSTYVASLIGGAQRTGSPAQVETSAYATIEFLAVPK